MSWRAEVIADRSGLFVGNELTFSTREDAAEYVADLMGRWMTVTDTRVVEGEWPVTHRWNWSVRRAERLLADKSELQTNILDLLAEITGNGDKGDDKP